MHSFGRALTIRAVITGGFCKFRWLKFPVKYVWTFSVTWLIEIRFIICERTSFFARVYAYITVLKNLWLRFGIYMHTCKKYRSSLSYSRIVFTCAYITKVVTVTLEMDIILSLTTSIVAV